MERKLLHIVMSVVLFSILFGPFVLVHIQGRDGDCGVECFDEVVRR